MDISVGDRKLQHIIDLVLYQTELRIILLYEDQSDGILSVVLKPFMLSRIV